MQTTTNKVELYTRKEVSELFKCSLRTIYNWTKSGRLKAYGLGSRVFYKVDEVHASLTPKF
jgi:excisionase family DNA binding protein